MTTMIAEAPLAPTLDQLRTGALDLHTHIDQMCDRIEHVDARVESLLPEPDRRARLHAEADVLLARHPAPSDRPLLFGALVGVKDIFHVDGFTTRAGTAVPPAAFAGSEAIVVTRLRAQGALVLGKTVTTEFAFFEPGPTRNPHNLEHTPGGSSSGSAAAVAAGLATLAIGTQTIGSVIRPAAFCGIVGFKPTLHRIPSQGIVYFSPTIDHVGLFTQDAAGMQRAASALLDDWRADLDMLPLPSLAVPIGGFLLQTDLVALEAFEQQVQRLRDAGIRVIPVPALEDAEELNVLHSTMVAAEFARQHAPFFAQYEDLYRPRTHALILEGQQVSDTELVTMRLNITQLQTELAERLDNAGADAWICPPAPGPAPHGIHATGDPALNLPWTHAGMPAVTLPAGYAANGLPLGIQIIARLHEDEELLTWTRNLEPILRPVPYAQ